MGARRGRDAIVEGRASPCLQGCGPDAVLGTRCRNPPRGWLASCFQNPSGIRRFTNSSYGAYISLSGLEQLLSLFLAAVIVAGLARRMGAPYPVFLALGGALLAFLPGSPSLSVPPELALALFVAPVLLDAAYDTSLRDLRDNWVPVTSLVVFAVGLTTAAVALVVRLVVAAMPWSAAIALGSIVAPPDAAAATAVLRQLRPPHRLLTILEGESLLNDASALLIYRLAVGAIAANGFSLSSVAPTFLLGVAGSIVVGPLLGWILFRFLARVKHVPTGIILQFVTTFGVWILAEQMGLSGVLTMVCYAATVAQTAPERVPARARIPSYAVWETVVFALNILAFIFIGLQIRPILESLQAADRGRYLMVAGVVLVTVIVVRIIWEMSFNAGVMWWHRRVGFHPPRPMARPTMGGALVISWAGMRGIVTLAAALALPSGFPYRDLIVLTAFSVVLGTLVVQGLTLKPLLRRLGLQDDDPVGREVRTGRRRALDAALSTLRDDRSRDANVVRRLLSTHLDEPTDHDGGAVYGKHVELHRRALQAARQAVLAMRNHDEIGDDAFHQIEEELDWLEMGTGRSAD